MDRDTEELTIQMARQKACEKRRDEWYRNGTWRTDSHKQQIQ